MYHIQILMILLLNIIHIQTRHLEETGYKEPYATGGSTLFPVNIFGMFDEAKNIFSNVVSKILDKRKVIGLESMDWL